MWITYLVHWLSVTHQLAATLCFTLMKNKPHWKDIMKLLAIWMIKMESVNCIVKNTMKKKHIQLLLPESIFLLELLPNSRKIQTPQVKSQIFSVYNDTETNLSFKTIWCPDCWLLQCSLPRWWLSVKLAAIRGDWLTTVNPDRDALWCASSRSHTFTFYDCVEIAQREALKFNICYSNLRRIEKFPVYIKYLVGMFIPRV